MPLLFASSRSFDSASRRGPPPCHCSCSRCPGGAKVTCSIVRGLPPCHRSCLHCPGSAKETRLILLFMSSGQREGHSLDRASWPTTLPPLLFASSGRREGHLFDRTSRQQATRLISSCGLPPRRRSCLRRQGAKVTCSTARRRRLLVRSRVAALPLVAVLVRVTGREGHSPAPLPPLLFALSGRRKGDLFARRRAQK